MTGIGLRIVSFFVLIRIMLVFQFLEYGNMFARSNLPFISYTDKCTCSMTGILVYIQVIRGENDQEVYL